MQQHGYPYEASFVVDNDFATGRIVDYLFHPPWWRDMAIFITESDTQESQDHVGRSSDAVLRGWSVCQAELCVPHEFKLSGIAADYL